MEYLLPFRGTSESNVCGYRNDTFDLLVGVAESTGDLTARAAFLHDAEAMLLEDSAVSPLCFSGTAYLLREGLTGVSHDCFGHSYFTAVSRAETDRLRNRHNKNRRPLETDAGFLHCLETLQQE